MPDAPSPRLTFLDCLRASARQPEFVAQFDRLTGSNLSFRGNALDLEIDETTGRTGAELAAFVAFVKDLVWDLLPLEIRDTGEGRDDA